MSVQNEERALRDLVRFVIMYVPRTHFDIAWWMIRRVFINYRFEPVMSEVVSTLEENPELKFTVDGQFFLVQRWIKNPSRSSEVVDRFNRVKALVQRGQLQVGPSYVLPDEFLATGESQIRNYLIGRELSVDVGAPEEQVIDESDVFMHPAQIPQIVAAFSGCYMFTRGLSKERIPYAAFLWVAPNGESVIAIPQPGGYRNGYAFGRITEDISMQTIQNFLDNYLARYEKDGVMVGLLCGGDDHTALGGRIQADLAAAIGRFVEVDFAIGTDNDYAASLDIDPAKLLRIENSELFGSGQENGLRHVDSARMYIKQRNFEVYRVLIHAEAAVSLAALRSHGTRDHWLSALKRCWSDFLVLQSHDAITGCHVDDVSDNMMGMYNDIEQELHMLLQEAMAELSSMGFDMSHEHRYGLAPTPRIGLWNPLPYSRHETVLVNLAEELQGTSRLAVLVNGQSAEIQRLDSTRAAISVSTGSFGSVSVDIKTAPKPLPAAARPTKRIRNEHLEVVVRSNGTYDVCDLASGRWFRGLGRLTSQGDRGDEYNRDLVGDVVDTSQVSAQTRLIASGPLVQELEITYDFEVPEHLDAATRLVRQGRATIPVKTTLRLSRGSRHLEVETNLVNTARDQLLRVAFPVGEKLEESRALSAFIVQPHPVPAPYDPDWKTNTTDSEPPFTTFSNQGMVIAGPFVSFNRGLTEYEVYDLANGKSELAITLYRGVSHLSQEDIRTRRGGAGPSLAVPGAQGLGEHTFAYTLGFVGHSSDIELAQASQMWQHGFVTAPFEINTNNILALQAAQSAYSALKPAEDGRGVILRLWAGTEPAWVSLEGDFSTRERLTVAEKPSPSRGLYVAHHEIASIRLV